MNLLFLILVFGLVALIYWYNRKTNQKRQAAILKKLEASWGKAKTENDFNFDYISAYFDGQPVTDDVLQQIPDESIADLDFHNVFKIIDRTVSKVGQQYLYYKLRTIKNQEDVLQFNRLSKLFSNDKALRLRSQKNLLVLNQDDAYHIEALINRPFFEKPAFVKYLLPLSIAALVFIVLGFLFHPFFLLLIPIFTVNMALHLKNKFYIQYVSAGIRQLRYLIYAGNRLANEPAIKTHFNRFDFLASVNEIRSSVKKFSYNQALNNEFLFVFWLLSEIVKIQFNIEALIFYRFIDRIVEKKQDINRLFRFIGEIDAAISTANLRAGNIPTCEPRFTEKKLLNIKDITNPLIKNCVPNSLILDGKSLLLTGSNMSGKTTFIKTVAINVILSETLYLAFAKTFELPFMQVYSSIKISDDILQDTSYYLEEVLRIKSFIEASQTDMPCLFVLDEIFKGTNTIERISGGKAILSYLNQPQHLVLVSTHDIELTDLLQQEDYVLYHFTEQIENEQLIFDHKLKKGRLKTRNAIKILELYDYPENIITDAERTQKRIEK